MIANLFCFNRGREYREAERLGEGYQYGENSQDKDRISKQTLEMAIHPDNFINVFIFVCTNRGAVWVH